MLVIAHDLSRWVHYLTKNLVRHSEFHYRGLAKYPAADRMKVERGDARPSLLTPNVARKSHRLSQRAA